MRGVRIQDIWQAPTKGPDRNPSGLGRAIINKKAKDAKRMQETGLVIGVSPSCCYITETLQYTTDLDSTSKLKSITQEKDLDAFLNTAELAGTEFTAGAQHPFQPSTPL